LFPVFRKRDGWVLVFGSRRVYAIFWRQQRFQPSVEANLRGRSRICDAIFEAVAVVRCPLLQSAIRARQRNPSIEYLKCRSHHAPFRCGRERSPQPIGRADTCILKRYLFSLVGWIIGLPRAGRPAPFTLERKGIPT
jgi:hypothetical protein